VGSRYLALIFGGTGYFISSAGKKLYENIDKSVKDGGHQIEYEDEDPQILELYERECATNGVISGMRQIVGGHQLRRVRRRPGSHSLAVEMDPTGGHWPRKRRTALAMRSNASGVYGANSIMMCLTPRSA